MDAELKKYHELQGWYLLNKGISIMKAAEQGDSIAQYNVGVMYDKGHDVIQDTSKAIEWFTKAAEQGDINAQRELCKMYTKKLITGNALRASGWFIQATEQGNADAQFVMAYMYFTKDGFEFDNSKITEWMRKAANNGHEQAQNLLNNLTKK